MKQGNIMELWEVDVTCPLCGMKYRLNKMVKHKNRHHHTMSNDEYEQLLIHKYEVQELTIDKRRAAKSGNFNLSATKLRIISNNGSSKLCIYSGGAVELGKPK